MKWIRIGLLAGIVLTTLPLAAHGQDVEWGFRAGPSVSNLRGDVFALVNVASTREGGSTSVRVTGWNPRNGIQFTGFVSLSVRNWLSLQTEVQYAQKGLSIELGEYEACGGPLLLCRPDLLRRSSFSYRISFLQMPALLRVRLPFGDAFRTSLVGGASLGVPLRTELATTEFWLSGVAEVRKPDPRGELGAVIGLEFSYRLADGGTLVVDARLNPGFTDLPLARTSSSVRTATGAVSVGYAFH